MPIPLALKGSRLRGSLPKQAECRLEIQRELIGFLKYFESLQFKRSAHLSCCSSWQMGSYFAKGFDQSILGS
jgi:hypothetical protein